MKVFKISTDGSTEVVEIDGNLKSMQEEVGGYIECVRIGDNHLVMVVNEEGLLEGLPRNPLASKLYPGVIVGDAFITRETGENFKSLSDKDITLIKARLA